MALENHPASFDIVGRSTADDDGPPPLWEFEGIAYAFTPGGEGWDVTLEDRLLGCLERDHPADSESPIHWRIRHPQNDGLGIGSSWGHWRDAVITLIDYRNGHDSPAD